MLPSTPRAQRTRSRSGVPGRGSVAGTSPGKSTPRWTIRPRAVSSTPGMTWRVLSGSRSFHSRTVSMWSWSVTANAHRAVPRGVAPLLSMKEPVAALRM